MKLNEVGAKIKFIWRKKPRPFLRLLRETNTGNTDDTDLTDWRDSFFIKSFKTLESMSLLYVLDYFMEKSV